MELPAVWFFLLLALTRFANFEASHFRGGLISWKPNSGSSYKVDFSFRLAFRRSFSFSFYCDASTVSSNGIIGTGNWNAASPGYSYSVGSAQYRCTDFSTQEDWSAGDNSFDFTFPHAGPWRISYSGCCWISLNSGGSSWYLSTTVNLTRRADTGQINSSPVSASSPIVRVQNGCPQDIRIPMEDPDGDVVRCRWAVGSAECGGICSGFQYSSLDEASCTLRYNGNGASGWYGVALMLEDFPFGTQDFSSTSPFSEVGLQFLVQVASSGGPCNRKPFFTGATPQDYACVDIAVGSHYSASLVAQHMDSSIEIVEINTVSVAGISISSLRSYYDQQGQKLYSRNVTWTPSSSAIGQHIFCYKALDRNGFESEQRCITLLVGTNNTPKVLLGTRSPNIPTVRRGPGHEEWSVHFDRLIKKPSHSKFIRIHLNNKEIYKLDTSSSYDVAISANRTALLFRTPYPVLSMRGNYFITMDTGAVVGMGCLRDGPATPGFSSSGDWRFYTSGVCSSGFYLGPDLYSCIDVNECENPQVRRKRSLADDGNDEESSAVLSRQRRAFSCPSYMSGYSGSFSSPNYPSNYPSYQSCSWRITVSYGYQVRVEFHTFQLYSGDYLRIYDGYSSSYPQLAYMSGYYYGPVYYSSGRYLWFYFYTNCCNSRKGFYATYTRVLNSSSSSSMFSSSIQPSSTFYFSSSSASVNSVPWECSNHRVLNEADRFVGYGHGYNCDRYFSGWYRFQGKAGSQMLESCVSRYSCGTYYPGWLNGAHPSVEDGAVSRQVCFYAWWSSCCSFSTYTTVRNCSGFYVYQFNPSPNCNSRYCGSPTAACPSSMSGYYSGSFSSPNFPNSYPNGESCSWRITVPRGYQVKVEFYTLDIRQGYDSLNIYDGPSSYSPWLTYFSGSYYNSSCFLYSSGTSLWFDFRASWWGVRGQGFYANYTAVPSSSSFSSVSYSSAQCMRVSSSTLSSSASSFSSSSSIQPSSTSYMSSSSSAVNSVPWECSNYRVLNEADRFVGYGYGYKCDNYLSSGWYRFQGKAGSQMSESCVSRYSCGTNAPGWLNGAHPNVEDGAVSRQACFNRYWCCDWSTYINVRNCSGFYVYWLRPISNCNSRFCGSQNPECPSSMSGYYSGSFSSPNFPNSTNGESCSWRITVPSGYRVKVEFHTLELGQGSDNLRIRDGPYSYSSHLARFYGDYYSSCSLYSTGTSLWFESRSYRWYFPGRGFYATYTAVPSSSSFSSVSYSSAQCMLVTSSPTPSFSVSSSSIQPSSVSRSPAPTSTPVRKPFVLRLPANCEHSCVNAPGSFNCTCRHGYQIGYPYGTCRDINECAVNNGGCSHHCVNTMGGYYCACMEGQTMSSDNHTCVEPGVNVECGQNQMQISLERKHFLSFNLNLLHLRHRDCQATSINDSHVTFVTLLNDCGTTHNESRDEIAFWNEVQADPVVIGGVVSRMHGISIPFYCVYNKKDLVSAVSYKPRRIVFAAEGGYGNMTFMMDLYQSASYLQPYEQKDYPVSVDVNQVLYVEYKVKSNEASLDVFAEKCWATPQPNPFTSPYYTFMEDGCALDVSMSFDNFSSSSKRFTIKAFRFFQFLDGYSTVYLHCELVACHVHTVNSRCSRGCQRFYRKRREADVSREKPESESSSKYSLSAGPITMEQKELADNGDTNESKAALIGGSAAASGFALVIIIALVVLVVKYRSVRRLMNRNKVGDMYAEENARKNAYVTENDMGTDENAHVTENEMETGEKDETSC